LLRRIRTPLVHLALAGLLSIPATALANHAVLVEGETSIDGDANFGIAEDQDGADGIFGTINGAISGMSAGMMGGTLAPVNLANNGKVIIASSGRFPEVVRITGPVTLEAAPGVEADIEAFLAPADPRLAAFGESMAMNNNMSRSMAPGIIVNVADPNAMAAGPVVIRNITTRNWTDGIVVMSGEVKIDGVRVEHNVSHGINVLGNARVQIVNSSIENTGFRNNANVGGFFPAMNPPTPGIGVRYRGNSFGDITRSSVTNNFLSGISVETPGLRDVTIRDVQNAGNNFRNQAGERTLHEACRSAVGRNLDEAEVCVQFIQRMSGGM
jgi:hypothetical protein